MSPIKACVTDCNPRLLNRDNMISFLENKTVITYLCFYQVDSKGDVKTICHSDIVFCP